MKMPSLTLPSVAALVERSLEQLRKGVGSSEEMRRQIAAELGFGPRDPQWPRFVNNHAWSLVRLQSLHQIRKVTTGHYELIPGAPPPPPETTTPIEEGQPLPSWARELVSRASGKNRLRGAPPFKEVYIRALWEACGGRCSLSGLPFRETSVGTGRAKKPFAPSLDRIDPTEPYTLHNTRLVLVAVNFSMNCWGEETFDTIAAAAVRYRLKRRG